MSLSEESVEGHISPRCDGAVSSNSDECLAAAGDAGRDKTVKVK